MLDNSRGKVIFIQKRKNLLLIAKHSCIKDRLKFSGSNEQVNNLKRLLSGSLTPHFLQIHTLAWFFFLSFLFFSKEKAVEK